MCLRFRPRSPRPPSWLNTGSLLLRDGEGKVGGRKEGRETGKGGRPGRGRGGKGREKKGGWDCVRERSGTGRKGRLFENVARGGGPTQNVARGPQQGGICRGEAGDFPGHWFYSSFPLVRNLPSP